MKEADTVLVPWRADEAAWRRSYLQAGIRICGNGGVLHLVRLTRGGYPIGQETLDVRGCSRTEAMALAEGAADQMLKRRADIKLAGEITSLPSDPQAQQRWPDLWEHLTATKWPEGEAREPSSLLIFTQDGSFKGMLRDKANGLCMWVAARGLLSLLDALEASLMLPEPDWRVDRQQPGQTARRVGKKG